MKKIITLAIVAAASFALAGCESLGLSKTKMDSDKSIKKVLEAYDEYIDTDEYKPISLHWSEDEKMSNNLGFLVIKMVGTDNNVYSGTYRVAGQYNGQSGDLKESMRTSRNKPEFETTHWLKPEDIDGDLFMKQIHDGASQIPTDEYNIKGVNNCIVEIDPKTGEITHKFSINVTEKGNATKMQGKTMVTTYYEVEFTGNPDGTATMKE